ncbi:MAG: hypothetical protein V1909_04750 [Candidatus Micrarchaeota archaeon]
MVSIPRALDKFKKEYSHVSAGANFFDVTDLFDGTRCRIVSSALARGQRVYALPLVGGDKGASGMFEKWKLGSDGHFVRGKDGKPIIKGGQKQIVAEFMCSPKTSFMGSDELIVGKEESVQGIERKRAEAVFGKLGIDPARDAYVIFVRAPDRIKGVVKIFRERLEAILTMGSKWMPGYRLEFSSSKLRSAEEFWDSFVGQIAGQVHPLLRDKIVLCVLGGPALADGFLHEKIVPAIRKASGKKNR